MVLGYGVTIPVFILTSSSSYSSSSSSSGSTYFSSLKSPSKPDEAISLGFYPKSTDRVMNLNISY